MSVIKYFKNSYQDKVLDKIFDHQNSPSISPKRSAIHSFMVQTQKRISQLTPDTKPS